MTDNPLRSELSSLERKVILLINEHKKMKDELHLKNVENQELKELIDKKEDQINSFQNQDKISKIVNGMIDKSNSKTHELGDMLNEYIKEVDKCIAQLSE